MIWNNLTIIGWIGLFIGIFLLFMSILRYVKKGNDSKVEVIETPKPQEIKQTPAPETQETQPEVLEPQTAEIVKADTTESKLDTSEAVEADGRIDSALYRGRQKRIGKNIEKETATLKKAKEAVEVRVDIEKTKVDGYKTVGDYDKLPPLEKQEVELTQKQTETKMMEQELEQAKIKQDMERLKQPKPVEENLSEVEKITQDLSKRAELARALEEEKTKAMTKAKTEKEKIQIERMYDDTILEVQDE